MPAVLFEKRNQIGYVTFNRPEVHNSFNPELLVRMSEIWDEAEKDDAVRAVIVTGAGKAAFSAGADLGKLIPLFTGARKPQDQWDHKLMQDRRIGDKAILRGYVSLRFDEVFERIGLYMRHAPAVAIHRDGLREAAERDGAVGLGQSAIHDPPGADRSPSEK